MFLSNFCNPNPNLNYRLVEKTQVSTSKDAFTPARNSSKSCSSYKLGIALRSIFTLDAEIDHSPEHRIFALEQLGDGEEAFGGLGRSKSFSLEKKRGNSTNNQ